MAQYAAKQAASDGGDVIIRLNIACTAVFVVASIAAAMLFTTGIQWVAALTSLGLFLLGIVAFVWSFWNAIQRSRSEQVAVTQLYFLAGGVAPKSVKRLMLSLLAVQVVVGLATALSRPNQIDGSPGTSLALGVLVPVFGFGLNGLWAASHGTFAERIDDVGSVHTTAFDAAGSDANNVNRPESGDAPSERSTISKNEEHG